MKAGTIKYFEYFVQKLLDKYENADKNDLSILKVQKLLFFTTAVDSGKSKDNTLIDKVFDNFVAMPFGHVESDVYNAIRNRSLKYFTINESSTIYSDKTKDIAFDDLNPEFLSAIEDAIDELLNINPDLLYETPFNLVELSHQYKSWKKNYHLAQLNQKNSSPIPKEEIIDEEKFFHLNQFELF